MEHVAEIAPDRIAVIDNHDESTYAQLRDRIERAVGTLMDAGVGDGDGVVLVAPNSIDSIAMIHGVIRVGGVAVVLDRRCGALDVENAVESSSARVIVVPAALRASLTVGVHGTRVIELEQVDRGQAVSDWVEPDPTRERFVVFTSGTTRRAKGVLHTLETMETATRNLASAMGFTDADRAFLASPIGTITGVSQVLMATRGASIVLEDRFDASASLDRIESHCASVIGGAPIILESLFAEYERRGLDHSALRGISLGGTMIPRRVLDVAIDRFGIRPTRVYGSSEVPIHTASAETDSVEQRLGDDGVPFLGCECRLGEAFESGRELEVRGPNLFQGYAVDEDNEHLFSPDGWFRTGDLVDLRDGRVTVRGRLKDVVARKGLKVSLAEVDDAAGGLPDVIEASAYGVADAETGERVVVAIRVEQGRSIDYDAVVAGLTSGGFARGKLPEEVVVWHEPLPRNPSGKVMRAELATQARGRPTSVAPRLRSERAEPGQRP